MRRTVNGVPLGSRRNSVGHWARRFSYIGSRLKGSSRSTLGGKTLARASMRTVLATLAIALGLSLAVILFVLSSRDDARENEELALVPTATRGDSRTSATATATASAASPSGPIPDLALAYTVGNGTQSVVVLDAVSSTEYRRYNLPAGVYIHRLRPNGRAALFSAEQHTRRDVHL